jgi:RimJ/RimL family protein N-acetyltransferase
MSFKRNILQYFYFIIILFSIGSANALSFKSGKTIRDILELSHLEYTNARLILVTRKTTTNYTKYLYHIMSMETVKYMNYMFQETALVDQPMSLQGKYLEVLYDSFTKESGKAAESLFINPQKRTIKYLSYLILSKIGDQEKVVGAIGVDHRSELPDIFIYVGSMFTKRGIGSAAVKILLKGLSDNFLEKTIEWDCSINNFGSNKLAKANNFKQVRIQKTKVGDWVYYHLTFP